MITIATDGSCSPNPGPGGWAWAAHDGRWGAGSFAAGTNNIGELTAIAEALLAHPDVPVHIVYDSKYAHDCVMVWAPKWIAKGDTSHANHDLIVSVIDHLAQRSTSAPVTWEWTRGHSGHPLNGRADALAGKMAALKSDERCNGVMAPLV